MYFRMRNIKIYLVFHHFSALIWCKSLKSFPVEDEDQFTCKVNTCCWWTSYTRCLVITSHGIDLGFRSLNCGWLVTWFCYQLIAKPGNKTDTVSWPDPYWDDLFISDQVAPTTTGHIQCCRWPLPVQVLVPPLWPAGGVVEPVVSGDILVCLLLWPTYSDQQPGDCAHHCSLVLLPLAWEDEVLFVVIA